MDKLVAMKIVAPLSLARFFLSDYERCKQKSDTVWELLVAAINKPVALVKTVRKVPCTFSLYLQTDTFFF